MVKRSKKSKSKRMPLRKKYKILKKVKEHHKKKAKEEKKRGAAGVGKKRVEKDPGIPNAWPLKEQELAAMEARRQRALEEKERVKEAKRAAREAARAGQQVEDASMQGEEERGERTMVRLVGDAGERSEEFERRKRKMDEGGDADASDSRGQKKGPQDGSRRAFYREVLRVVEAADVVVEVLDARDPLGCRCPELERLVLRGGSAGRGGPKRLVLLLNKIDLVPREVVEKWLKYLREELPAVAFRCSTQQQRANLGGQRGMGAAPRKYGGPGGVKGKGPRPPVAELEGEEPIAGSTGSRCLGADTLIQLLKNYCRNKEIKTAITVGVVGLPNVGKSSLINSLKRARVANVGSTPGVTRSLQEVHLDKHVKLLDCPGIVMSSTSGDDVAAAALRNAVRVEQLTDPTVPVRRIVQLCSKDALMSAYKIARFADADEFVRSVAFARGRLRKGGVPDTVAAARLVLADWNEGRIPFYTLPPKRPQPESLGAEVAAGPELVGDWGAEFDAEAVFREEESAVIAALPGRAERAAVFAELPAGQPVAMERGEDADVASVAGEGGTVDDIPEAEEMENDEGDSAGEMETDGLATTGMARESKSAGQQKETEDLYKADGILNPQTARADRKKRKKDKRRNGGGSQQPPALLPAAAAAAGDDLITGEGSAGRAANDDDYDFEEAFACN